MYDWFSEELAGNPDFEAWFYIILTVIIMTCIVVGIDKIKSKMHIDKIEFKINPDFENWFWIILGIILMIVRIYTFGFEWFDIIFAMGIIALIGLQIDKSKTKHGNQQKNSVSLPVPNPQPVRKKKSYQTEDVYIPLYFMTKSADIPEISLTAKEAVNKGFSFQKKSKSVRITNYHGNAQKLTIPAYIDNLKVNEIKSRAFFRNQTVRKLKLPGTIRKIGKSAFSRSQIEICIFADGLGILPERAFAACQHLEKVTLPKTLHQIDDYAFAGCRNLKYIHFPLNRWNIGKNAFSFSGLEGFSIEKPYQRVTNGNAFRFTPLEKNHTLIIGNHVDKAYSKGLYVLLVGQKSKEILVPECSWLIFGRNAFNENHAWISLFLHQARKNIMFDRSFDEIEHQIPLYFYFSPDYQRSLILPRFVHAYQGTNERKELPCHLQRVGNNDESVITFPVSDNITWQNLGYSLSRKTVLQSKQKGILYRIEKNAFQARNLRELILDLSFRAPEQTIFGNICCHLQKVVWYEDNQEVIKYLPDSALIGVCAHSVLLQAFRQNPDGKHFFDSQVIFDAMTKNTSGVHTRQRIFIALDALRSKKRKIDRNTDFYLHYLEKHKEQAELLFQEYPDYLEYFRNLPFID